jgi:nitric oxide synthase oxygenase domain/subunit
MSRQEKVEAAIGFAENVYDTILRHLKALGDGTLHPAFTIFFPKGDKKWNLWNKKISKMNI